MRGGMQPAKLGMFELLQAALRHCQNNMLAFIGFALLPMVPLIVVGLLALAMPRGIQDMITPVLQVIALGVSGLSAGMVVLLAYDRLAGVTRPVSAYVTRVSGLWLPLFVLSAVSALLMLIGLYLVILPGLIAMALFLPLVSVILFEDAGMEGLVASFKLVAPRLWPTVGLCVMLVLVSLAIVLAFVILGAALATTTLGLILLVPIVYALSALLAALHAVTGMFLYMHLRELDLPGRSVVTE